MSYNQPPPPGGYGAPQPGAYGAPQPRPAELMDRFLARLIDGILLTIVSFVIGLVLAAILIGSGGEANYAVTAIGAILGLAISLGYYVFFETTSGQTLGKKAMKLKVVGPAGAPVTPAQSVKRNFFYLFGLLALVPLGIFNVLSTLLQLGVYIFIAVTISQDKQLRQGFHDKLANETYVMKLG
ncbi:putative RDD family membrane protein YckC [Nocardioides zeae]|uniref:RDD family membrane protein YckC n=2 Tax=Nocardioides zeae TaxID=1457234 RepID=A0ACC6II83_9ACTN|nr:RDD family protein [Nocardioides zeae]MDQ1104053.1 putative RDD family membrane protein YckC [Nocardioides zeae]MDR6176255.1 putative RDD family membrane protein YckC [Nocardioides zeae]MDR6210401.1 putative RDD family membrane protein YckC [Nocardioides zeae]